MEKSGQSRFRSLGTVAKKIDQFLANGFHRHPQLFGCSVIFVGFVVLPIAALSSLVWLFLQIKHVPDPRLRKGLYGAFWGFFVPVFLIFLGTDQEMERTVWKNSRGVVIKQTTWTATGRQHSSFAEWAYEAGWRGFLIACLVCSCVGFAIGAWRG